MDRTTQLRIWLEQVHDRLEAAAGQFPRERWEQPPPAGGWSAAEVVAHLCQSEEAIQAGMKKLFAAEPRPVPWWKRFHLPPALAQWRFVRGRSPIPLDTSLLDEKEEMLSRYRTLREATLELMELKRDDDLSRWRYPHPFFGSLDGYTWFKSLGYHEIRHTKQLQEIWGALP